MSPTSNPQSVVRRSSSIALSRRIVVGTRGSTLAQWQARYIVDALKRLAPDLAIELRIIKTLGDKDQTRSLAELGGLGVFTKEIEHALRAREIDLAVHSLKDLPTDLGEGLTIAGIPAREDARDCLVSRHGVGLEQLPRGARVGTSSARRTAQLLARRPDLDIVPLRGNVDTRLRKAQSGEYDAVVLAAAGLTRLERTGEITEYLPFDTMLPDPGQGALAVQVRADDTSLAELVSALDDAPTRVAVLAERAFLRTLGGGCRMPMGAYADLSGEKLSLRGMVGSLDGTRIVRGEIQGEPDRAEEWGTALARRLLAQGAAEILGIPVGEADRLPLQGKRILITRARDQASALAERIRSQGGEAIEFPTIDFAPLEDFGELDAALAQVTEFDWVVFTSANGVRAVADRLAARGLTFGVFASRRIAAIGPATARALEQLGVRVDFIPTKFLGEQIAIELPVEAGQRVLLLRADIASDVLARGLEARGVKALNVDAYRTIMPRHEPESEEQAVEWRKVDAVTFTSSSTVRNFIARLDSPLPEHIAVFCIGPVTAETARESGMRVDAVASEHTMDGLVRAIAEYYQASQSSFQNPTPESSQPTAEEWKDASREN